MTATVDDDCIHGLGPPVGCVICNGRERQQRKQEKLESHLTIRQRKPKA